MFVHFNLKSFKLKQPEVPDMRIDQPTLVDELKSGKITVINSMPACKEECKLPRIPVAIKKESAEESIHNFNLDYVNRYIFVLLHIYLT